jgi:hypothetical protein
MDFWVFPAFLLNQIQDFLRQAGLVLHTEIIGLILKFFVRLHLSSTKGIVNITNTEPKIKQMLVPSANVVVNSSGDIYNLIASGSWMLNVAIKPAQYFKNFLANLSNESLAIDHHDNLYVCGSHRSIEVYDKKGKQIRTIGENGIHYRGIAINSKGEIYVGVDNVIHRHSSTGTFLQSFGSREVGLEYGVLPSFGLCTGVDDEVHVMDARKDRIQVFSKDGKYLRKYGNKRLLKAPTCIAVDVIGNSFVGDVDCIKVFSRHGAWLGSFGSLGEKEGQFRDPLSLFICDGILYVSDYYNQRIQICSKIRLHR